MIKSLIVFLFVPLLAFSTFEWVTLKLDDHVSVSFPSQPTSKDLNGIPGWISVPDTNSLFMCTITDMEKFGLDSATLTPLLEQPEFYDQFKTGAMGKFGTVKLVYDTLFKWNGQHACEFKVKKEDTNLTFLYENITMRSIFIGTKVYTLSVLQKAITKEDQTKFFNSFRQD